MGHFIPSWDILSPEEVIYSLENMIYAQNKLVPEMMNRMERRFQILTLVKMKGPIGRRTLGDMAELSERETRSVLDQFRVQQLISISSKGAMITATGEEVLETLKFSMEQSSGRLSLANQLTRLLGIKDVKIVSGNSDTSLATKESIGLEAANEFSMQIGDAKTVAVTGGSTVASIPNYIKRPSDKKKLLFVAARGGVGESLALQANVIAAKFSEAYGGDYLPFYYPDSLCLESHVAFHKEKDVVEMMQLYEKVDCVIHGIGDAKTMAALRGTSNVYQRMLQESKAEGEAFGYYFDYTGKTVHQIRTVGIQIEQLKRVPLLLATAGGKSKAKAILSYLSIAPAQTILITDEGAAQEMLNDLTKNKGF